MITVNPNWCIPIFEETIFRERSSKYVLVIPVINEGRRIRKQLEHIHNLNIFSIVDVVLADGGSTDGSLDEAFMKQCAVRALLVKHDTGKLSAQLRMGYSWALAQGYEGIITIDGNGKDSVESIPLFVEKLQQGVDYAQASRFIKGGKSINTPFVRTAAIRLIHAPLISLAARHWLTDTTQGFRGYSSRYLLDERVQPFRECFMDYELLAYLSVRAPQLGYKVVEVPTIRTYPEHDIIPTKISPVRGSSSLLFVLFKTYLRHYHPKSYAN